jgi:hypothetical protein
MPDAAAVPPLADAGDGARGRRPDGLPAVLGAASPAPPRISLCFARTELGDRQVRDNQTVLPLHVARLLLLFEGPQTVEDLRRMIDAPWLPEALIELERRRLIHRIAPQRPQPRPLGFDALHFGGAVGASRGALDAGNAGLVRGTAPGDGRHLPPAPPAQAGDDPVLDRRRALTRIMFLRLLGSLGSDMARRIDQCRSAQELDELMPQVDALIEAIAGRHALGEFRQQTTRSS